MSALRGAFSFLRPTGVVGGTAIGTAVGQGVAPAIRPVIQDLANAAWEAHQARPLEASIAAALVAEQIWTHGQGTAEAARTGINADRFGAMVEQARHGPTIEQAFEGVRRNIISGARLTDAMRQAGVRPEWDELMRALLEVLPPLSDVVHFAVREAYDEDQVAALGLDAEYPAQLAEAGEALGLSAENTRRYWRAHWGLPSYEQGVSMLHRGLIDSALFSRLMKALDYSPTWRARLEALAERIPPLTDMIRFAVREAYDDAAAASLGLDDGFPDVFAREAALHGLDPVQARRYWRAHWRLPSATQMFRMLWRGIISEAQLDQGLKALDYPPLWRDRLSDMARLVPGRIDLKRMLRHEILTPEQVRAGYERLGYAPADAQQMTDIAVAELEAAEGGGTWESRARGRLYTVAHDEYLDGSIDGATASAMLTRVGALPAERGRIIALWDAEKTIVRLELTPAQIKKAARANRYTEAEAMAELQERGMTAEDAADYLAS